MASRVACGSRVTGSVGDILESSNYTLHVRQVAHRCERIVPSGTGTQLHASYASLDRRRSLATFPYDSLDCTRGLIVISFEICYLARQFQAGGWIIISLILNNTERYSEDVSMSHHCYVCSKNDHSPNISGDPIQCNTGFYASPLLYVKKL